MHRVDRVGTGIVLAAVAVLTWFTLLHHLGRAPLLLYDEGLYAVNATEMARTGNLMVPTSGWKYDGFNQKPIFALWLMAGSVRLLGESTLALRLPSALCGVATVIALLAFAFFCLGDVWAGLVGSLILLSSGGFVSNHVTRTGDLDGTLTFLVTLWALCAFQTVESVDRPSFRKWLLAMWVALTLALFTKGVAAVLGAPGVVVYAALRRRVLALARRPTVWIAVVTPFALLGAYYAYRSHLRPQFFDWVIYNELYPRLLEVKDSHSGPASYYLKDMWQLSFRPWVLFLPAGFLVLRRIEGSPLKKLVLYALCFVGVELVVLSSARTKLWWYPAPIYPLAALMLGAVAVLLIRTRARLPIAATAAAALLGLVFVPYRVLFATVEDGEHVPVHGPAAGEYEIRDALGAACRTRAGREPIKVLTHGFEGNAIFYTRIATREGCPARTVGTFRPPDIVPGDVVISCDEALGTELRQRFDVTVLVPGPCERLRAGTARGG